MKRITNQALLAGAAALCMVASCSLSAEADYIAPPVQDEFTILADKWELLEGKTEKPDHREGQILATCGPRVGNPEKTYTLEVIHAGKKMHFPVDRFMLAHNTDSNTICCGSYLQYTETYLNELRQRKPRPDALVMLGAVGRATATVSVVGIWAFDGPKAWDRAIQQGARTLDLSAENVRKLGTPVNYRAAIVKSSDSRWSKFLAKHPAQN